MTDAQETAALSTVARQRSQTYWWLSEIFLAAPDAAVVARLREQATEASGGADEAPLKARLTEIVSALDGASAEALAVEHARLFAGLAESYGPPPPFESIHSRVPAEGEAIPSMVDAYRAAGFDRIDVPSVPQDHIAVELRFMALLAARESTARDASDIGTVRALLAHQQQFLDHHLLSWVPAYCDRIAAAAREPFFAAVAQMTADALALDRENLDDLIRETAIA